MDWSKSKSGGGVGLGGIDLGGLVEVDVALGPATRGSDRRRVVGELEVPEDALDDDGLGDEGDGHSACRAGHKVLFLRSDHLLRMIHQSRADNSTERVIRSLLAPDLLIIDDFGLRRLNAQQSSDFYEIIIERHRRASTVVTSNRSSEEWIPLFDDPILAQSALDRLAQNAYQIVIEGDSYRTRQRPGRTPSTSTQTEKKQIAGIPKNL